MFCYLYKFKRTINPQIMKKKLFKAVFEKAKNQSGSTTRNGLSKYLENIFMNELRFNINQITFVRYYKKYIEENEELTSNPNTDLLNKSAEYLDYKNYEDFVSKNISVSKVEADVVEIPKPYFKVNKKNKFTVIAISIFLFVLLIGTTINQPRWMVWNNDHYIEVNFDLKKYDIGELEVYSEERIKYLKKIKANCEVEFFDKSGDVKIWYGKNRQSDLELFTSIGLHPETGKTLKPITKYMIKKYFCQNYK